MTDAIAPPVVQETKENKPVRGERITTVKELLAALREGGTLHSAGEGFRVAVANGNTFRTVKASVVGRAERKAFISKVVSPDGATSTESYALTAKGISGEAEPEAPPAPGEAATIDA